MHPVTECQGEELSTSLSTSPPQGTVVFVLVFFVQSVLGLLSENKLNAFKICWIQAAEPPSPHQTRHVVGDQGDQF